MNLSRKSFLQRILGALALIPFLPFKREGDSPKRKGFVKGSGRTSEGNTIKYDSPWQYVMDVERGRLNGCLPPVIVDTGEPIQLADVRTPIGAKDQLRCNIASSVAHIFNHQS